MIMTKTNLLIRAIKANNLEAVKALIEKTFFKKWLLNSTDKDGVTPLLYAIRDADEAMVMYLLNKGADVNKKGNNDMNNCPLSVAILTKNFSMLELLLIHPNIDTDVKVSNEKCNLLDFAAMVDNFEFIKNYGTIGFYVTINTVKLYLLYNKEKVDPEKLTFLLKNIANINEPIFIDKDYNPSLLEIAVYATPIKVVEQLLEMGADPNYKDKTDWTRNASRALSHAISVGDLDKVKLLVKHNAKIDPSRVLFSCAIKDNLEIMKYFLDMGIDPNPVTQYMFKSETLLEYVVKLNKLEMTKLLMQYIENK